MSQALVVLIECKIYNQTYQSKITSQITLIIDPAIRLRKVIVRKQHPSLANSVLRQGLPTLSRQALDIDKRRKVQSATRSSVGSSGQHSAVREAVLRREEGRRRGILPEQSPWAFDL